MRFRVPARLALLLSVAACTGPSRPGPAVSEPTVRAPVTISVVSTNDLHGHVEMLPLLSGYVSVLRDVRKGDGGVLLLDGGDMFQGTLESNLNEGAAVVQMYNAMGYAAAAVGNHEFDFGPVGEKPTPEVEGDDPRGAIKARVRQANFAVLTANITRSDGAPLSWAKPSTIVMVRGVKVGIIGLSTMSTPYTTIATNFAGLMMGPQADATVARAKELRARGAEVVIVTAHAGGRCREFDDPLDLSSCVQDAEIFEFARALPQGTVDLIVGGHSHAGVAHVVNGVPIIEAYAQGIAFGRADIVVTAATKSVEVKLHPPRFLCKQKPKRVDGPVVECDAGDYEGRPVQVSADVAKLAVAPHKSASKVKSKPLGVTATAVIKRAYGEESALGNLFTDLMLAAQPTAHIAITNGGGLRADLPAGDLTYGHLYEAMPFDNRFAFATMTGAHFEKLMRVNLGRKGGVFSVAGVRVLARCAGDKLEVQLMRNGKRLRADEQVTVVTSDFLAAGGDGALGQLDLPRGAIRFDGGGTIRDAMAAELGKRAKVDPATLLIKSKPRFSFPGKRPVHCGAN